MEHDLKQAGPRQRYLREQKHIIKGLMRRVKRAASGVGYTIQIMIITTRKGFKMMSLITELQLLVTVINVLAFVLLISVAFMEGNVARRVTMAAALLYTVAIGFNIAFIWG